LLPGIVVEEVGFSNWLIPIFAAICSPHFVQQLAGVSSSDYASLMQKINKQIALPVKERKKKGKTKRNPVEKILPADNQVLAFTDTAPHFHLHSILICFCLGL